MKFRNENDLSDITWAMCESFEQFRTLFLNFFFPEYTFDNIREFKREYTSGNSRPDFYIKNNEDIFIIEVKIYDSQHHFEQYITQFNIPKTNLGYITNYNLFHENYRVKTWKQFYYYIDKFKQIANEEEGLMYTGYLTYIKNICSIVKISQKMNLSNLQTIMDFNETLKEVTNFENNTFRLENYKQEVKSYKTGYYFKVSDKSTIKKDIWIWIGAYYSTTDHQICISVDANEGWGKPFYDIIDPNIVELDDNTYFFYPTKGTEYFNQLDNYESQKEYLTQFIEEVVNIYLNN